jgi:hypothetical protein
MICFTCNNIYFKFCSRGPPLWSSYSSKGPGFDSRRFQVFWEAADLERGPLSLVRTTEELLGRKSSGSGPENRDKRPRESVALTTQHPLSAKVGTTSPTSGGRSVGIVCSRTKATGFSFIVCSRRKFLLQSLWSRYIGYSRLLEL